MKNTVTIADLIGHSPANYSRDALRTRRGLRNSPDVWLSNQITFTTTAGIDPRPIMSEVRILLSAPRSPEYRQVCAGDIMRAWAHKHQKEIQPFVQDLADKPEYHLFDEALDGMTWQYARQNHLLMCGRMVHVVAECGFHVALRCPHEVLASKLTRGAIKTTQLYLTTLEGLRTQDNLDRERFDKKYPRSHWPDSDFDLVLDIGADMPQVAAQTIVAAHSVWSEGREDKLEYGPCVL